MEDKKQSGDRSQNDPHPEVEFSASRASKLTDSDTEETSHMVTGVQEETPYCLPMISSGKQKKAHSTSQPHFRGGNTPATFEADQVFFALQQLASNSSSVSFNNSINRIYNCPFSSRQQCLPLMENQKISNCLRICSKQV